MGFLPISIHVPLAGHDQIVCHILISFLQFQSTCPLRGTTLVARHCRRGKAGNFNPRAPCGARPFLGRAACRRAPISIHVPLAGHDDRSDRHRQGLRDFNPRAPCGARRSSILHLVPSQGYFNPRAPCGARLKHFSEPSEDYDFNPRAPCGARRDLSSKIDHRL